MTEKKRTADFYHLAGQKVRTPLFTWAVYGSYEIVDIDEYFYRYKTDVKNLYRDQSVEECYFDLEYKKLIVPKYGEDVRKYFPLEDAPNLSASFAQLNKYGNDSCDSKFLSDDCILHWVSTFGLLSYRPLSYFQNEYLRHIIKQDWSMPDAFATIGELLFYEEALRFNTPNNNYVMLRDTFTELQELASLIFHATIAFIENDQDQSLDVLRNVMPEHLLENLFEEEFLVANETKFDSFEEIRRLLYSTLSLSLAGVRLSLSFEKEKLSDGHVAVSSWIVNDLWSAMMLQLHDYLVVNQTFRKCPSCGNYFSMKGQRNDRIYCPEGMGKYADCKQYAKDSKRKKI